jgi:hypothetical protein
MRRWVVLMAVFFLLLASLSACASALDDNVDSNNNDYGSPGPDASDSSNTGNKADDSALDDDRSSTSDSSRSAGTGDQDQNRLNNQTVDQDQVQDQTQDRDQIEDQDRLNNTTDEESPDRTQNQTRTLDATELHDQIQDRIRQLDQDQLNLSEDRRKVLNQYNNESAFVYTLQNQSDQFGDVGPQLSQYAMQLNISLQTEIQVQERMQSRSSVVRFFVGGDEVAAGELEQETLRTQQRIQEMNQLIQQCSCDPQVRALLQDQLQQMEQQQVQLRQQAQMELQDKGLIGWLWK